MTKRERLMTAIRGGAVDRIPVSLWQHFPNRDRTAEELAEQTVQFQRRYDFDFVKMTPMGLYGVEDWGTVPRYFPGTMKPPVEGTYGVQSDAGWAKVRPLDVTRGRYGQEVSAVRMVRRELGPEVPVLQTIFSPLTTARKLAGDLVVAGVRENSARLRRALGAITETTVNFARACLEAGADGLFFATQCATSDLLTQEEYRIWGRPYDLEVLEAVRGSASIVLLHIHGLNVYFRDLVDYPVDIINWHDRRTTPSLREARSLTGRCLAGGVDELGTLVNAGLEEVAAQVRDAIAQCEGKGLVVSPGCVVPPDCPEQRYRAVLQAAHGWQAA